MVSSSICEACMTEHRCSFSGDSPKRLRVASALPNRPGHGTPDRSRLGVAADPVPVAVEPVRIRFQHREVGVWHVGTVQVGWRRRDAHGRIGGVTLSSVR